MSSAWTRLRGHQEQRALFERSMRNHRLSHAYILAGPDGVGKRTFARLLAQSLFCQETTEQQLEACGTCRNCRSFESGNWPDYFEIGLPDGKTEIPLDLILGSTEKRGREGLCYELSSAPLASNRRIAVIDDAQRMNLEGCNALLKTLEEPPANALILLISDSPEALLPTIRSRCQLIRFFPLVQEDLEQLLVEKELVRTHDEARAAAMLADGSITQAEQLLNPELRELRDFVGREFAAFEAMRPQEVSRQIADRIEKISSSTEDQRQNTRWLLSFLADAVRLKLRRITGGDLGDPLLQRLGLRCASDLLATLVDRILQAILHVDANSPVRLVLDSLFDDLARAMRLGPTSAR